MMKREDSISADLRPNRTLSERTIASKLVLALIAFLGNGEAFSANVFGSAFYGPEYHMSTEMKVVEVTLRHPHTSTKPRILEVPRAFITYMPNRYDGDSPKFPDQVTRGWFKAGVWLPTGEPYSVAFERLKEGQSFGAIDARRGYAFLDVHYVTRDRATSIRQSLTRPAAQLVGEYEGLKVVKEYPTTGELDYYSDRKDFPFISISCPKTSLPGALCTYNFLICPDLLVRAQFNDFRVRGGLKFAVDNLSRIRGVTSQWIQDCK